MARLMNTKNQPIKFYYIGKKVGKKVRRNIIIPPNESVEVSDYIEPISKGDIENGGIVIMSDSSIKMMNAEKDAMSYMESNFQKDNKTNK